VDKLLLVEIYPAPSRPYLGVSGESLAQGIRQVSSTDVTYFQNFEAVNEALPEILDRGDIFITLGAGKCVDHWTKIFG
jgi:UDP-N-acetylmuramate--L-alanine ligase (EC 6.3.2.8)